MAHPVVCTLTPETLAIRTAQLLPGVARQAEVIEERPDGYRMRFAASSEMLQTLIGMIAAERQCCRFLHFQLSIEAGEGPVWLSMSGPPGTREFLAGLMDL